MPFYIVRNDITKMEVDAIVNAANCSLLGGGGVDGAIHRAAGPQLLEACKVLHGCEVGEAKLTPAFLLPSKYVIHTVGPEWMGGGHGEAQLLRSCYENALRIAAEQGFASVAFPLISAGAYGYPKTQALRIAVDSIGAFLLQHDMDVYLTVYDADSFALSGKLFADIQAYIDDNYVDEAEQLYGRRRSAAGSRLKDTLIGMLPKRTELPEQKQHRAERNTAPASDGGEDIDVLLDLLRSDSAPAPFENAAGSAPPPPVFASAAPSIAFDELLLPDSLEDALAQADETFSQMLLRKIDACGMTDAECYKKANIDRKLFSKIRKDPLYRPAKSTALAFAIALQLPLEETEQLLKKAGFALSNASKFDIIVRFFIERGNYNIFEINEALFAFDQSLLGG